MRMIIPIAMGIRIMLQSYIVVLIGTTVRELMCIK